MKCSYCRSKEVKNITKEFSEKARPGERYKFSVECQLCQDCRTCTVRMSAFNEASKNAKLKYLKVTT